MICQELKCKKKEDKNHIGTLCAYHAIQLEKQQNPENFFLFRKEMKFKTINRKNAVWEEGCEHIRSIPTKMINAWINNAKKKKQTLEDMIKLIQEQMKITDEKIEEHQKTKNSRYVKHEY